MLYDFKIARKLVFKNQKGFYNKAKIITIFSIAISVASMLISFSAFRGYLNILTDIYKKSNSDIIISDTSYSIADLKEYILNIESSIDKIKYFGYLELIVAGKDSIRGVVFETVENSIFEDKVIDINSFIIQGSADNIFNGHNVLLGYELASILNVGIDDTINVFYIDENNKNETKVLNVSGVFKYGLYDIDSRFAYISIDTGKFLVPNSSYDNSLKIKIKDKDTFKVAKMLESKLPNIIQVKTWYDINYSMFKAVEMDRSIIFIILTVLIAVSIFNVLSTLILLVKELKVEICILQVLGFRVKRIIKLFFIKAIILGFSSYLLGVFIWLTVIFVINKWGIIIIPKDIYLVSKIPIGVSLLDMFIVFLVVIVLSILGAIVPALYLNINIKKQGVIYGIKSYKA